jgi:tetratricopeptide (TPR) repeat protein
LAAAEADAERTVTEMRRLVEAAPMTWAYDAGLWELRVNRPEVALEHFERLFREAPGAVAPVRAEHWARWSDALHRLGRDGEALDVAKEGRKHHPESESLLEREIAALAGLGRVDEVNRQAWKSAVHREGLCAWRAALELWAHGHEEAAAAAASSAVRLNTHPFVTARATLYFEGDVERASAMMNELLRSHPNNLDYLGMSGVLAARQDELATILDVDHRLETWTDPHIRGQNTYWRAKIAAARGEQVSAVRLLSQAVAEGMYFSEELHRDIGLAQLRGYPPFEAFMAH